MIAGEDPKVVSMSAYDAIEGAQPDAVDVANAEWDRVCTFSNEASNPCARLISRIGWARVMVDLRLRAFPIGVISPGMPYFDESTNMLHLPIPTIENDAMERVQTQLNSIMSDVLAPDRIVRRKADNQIGRVTGHLGANTPIVTHIHNVRSNLGQHWGVDLHDSMWMGCAWKTQEGCYFAPCPNETRATRNRRYTLLNELNMRGNDAPWYGSKTFGEAMGLPWVWCGKNLIVVDAADEWIAADGADAELERDQQSAFGF